MSCMLVRVGVDQGYGKWNAPVDPDTLEFVYVPIPEREDMRFQPGLSTSYADLRPALVSFGTGRQVAPQNRAALPPALTERHTHLDPDFDHLTYGDNGVRRGKELAAFGPGDSVVFFAGLRPCRPCEHRLLYAIVGYFRIAEVVRVASVPRSRWGENAHTRRGEPRGDDIVVRADPARSGRLRRCIPIGEWRERAYRIRSDLLRDWGGISATNGYIQRSAVPPTFTDPERFLKWFERQKPELVAQNNTSTSAASKARRGSTCRTA
jgi:hypothetical protein